MLHVFINYDHDEPIMLINCIDHLQEHLKLSHEIYICSTETKEYLKDIQSAADCKILYNEQEYNLAIQSAVNDYKMFIDYGTMLTKDITMNELLSCYFYTNKLDYICKDDKESIPNKYLYGSCNDQTLVDSCNDQTLVDFLQHPNDTYTHFDVGCTTCSATYYTGVVAIGKGEEDYLDEWINYHLQLGFDKIYFYDNNPKGNTKQKDICEKYQQVVYRDVRGWPTKNTDLYIILQMYVYDDAYLKNDCKYLLFIDIDEFLVLKDNHNLHDLLRFKKYIHINWQMYGDDEQIYKENKPVQERFTIPVTSDKNKHIKTFVQTKNNDVEFVNPHYCICQLNCTTPSGSVCNGSLPFVEPPEHDYAVINHYFTKSTEEFINKMMKGSAGGQIKTFDMYFNINKKTQEKIDFFKKVYPYKTLNIFVNYDHADKHSVKLLSSCIEYLCRYVSINYVIYVIVTPEEKSTIDILQSITDFKYICDENTYQEIINEIDKTNDYKMFIDYGTILTKSITNDNIHSCYIYTNKLDYICRNNEEPTGYFYDMCNDQTLEDFLEYPNNTYTHFNFIYKPETTYYTGVVAIGKGEEDYLDEWINHYLSIGFDKIYFYDNNPKGNTKQKDICEKYQQVVYRDVRGWPTQTHDCSSDKYDGTNEYQHLQFYVYNHAYLCNECKYLLFVDIDEFLDLGSTKLRDMIRFKKYIHIPWKVYGDSEQLHKVNKPVQERFTIPSATLCENTLHKTLIQTGNRCVFNNPHYCETYMQCYSPSGIPCYGLDSQDNLYKTEDIVIKHYVTKSTEEYVDKMKKGAGDELVRSVKYYFYINKYTPEKEKILKKYIENSK